MEARILEQEGWEALPTTPDRQAIYGSIDETQYHVSIRWNEADNSAVSRCDACGRADCRNDACLDENLLPPNCRPL